MLWGWAIDLPALAVATIAAALARRRHVARRTRRWLWDRLVVEPVTAWARRELYQAVRTGLDEDLRLAEVAVSVRFQIPAALDRLRGDLDTIARLVLHEQPATAPDTIDLVDQARADLERRRAEPVPDFGVGPHEGPAAPHP